MNMPCEVIRDLIPLCKDGVASQESCHLVEEHVALCPSCRKEYEEAGSAPVTDLPMTDEKQFIKNLQKYAFKMQGLLLLSGAILGVSMTFSMNIFYNFILMPFVGILSFFIFHKRFYIGPILVFVLSMISNFIYGVFNEGISLRELSEVFTSWGIYSTVYASLVFLGCGIGWLLLYAFGKEEKVN